MGAFSAIGIAACDYIAKDHPNRANPGDKYEFRRGSSFNKQLSGSMVCPFSRLVSDF